MTTIKVAFGTLLLAKQKVCYLPFVLVRLLTSPGVTAGMHEVNTKCLDAVTNDPMRYVQLKGADVKDYAQLMAALNLKTAADEAWFRATFLNKFEDNKIHPDNAPSMDPVPLDSDSASDIRFSLFGRKDPRHKHGREYVDVTIPEFVSPACL